MTDPTWSSHRPAAPRTEPVTIGLPLWQLTKDGHAAVALVRPIEGVGVELRYEWDGELRASQVFTTWDELLPVADEKRRELEARAWIAIGGGTKGPDGKR
jgi:hypothetical protein